MEIQTRVAPTELWLRDDLENIYALLFLFLGFGFRLGPREAHFVHVVDLARQSVPWSSRGGTRVSSGLVARQMEEPEELFAAGSALQLSPFQDTSDWPPFVLLCSAADVRRRCFHCVLRLGDCLLCHGSGEVFAPNCFPFPQLFNLGTTAAVVASDILVGAQPRIICWRIGRHSHSTTSAASGRRHACGAAVPISPRPTRPTSTQRCVTR